MDHIWSQSLDCSILPYYLIPLYYFFFLRIFIIGVAIGSGWQVMVAYINLVCYYIVGLPIGIFLGFKQNLGVKVPIYLLFRTFTVLFVVVSLLAQLHDF